MILVLLGTQNNSFHRLLEEIEKNITEGTIKEEVIVQAGYTKYKSHKMRIIDLISREELEKLQDEANLIISSIRKQKKVIAVPRLHEYGEHVNNHQIDIIKRFSEEGYIIGIYEVKDLKNAIEKVKQFEPKKYELNNKLMIRMVEEFIDGI